MFQITGPGERFRLVKAQSTLGLVGNYCSTFPGLSLPRVPSHARPESLYTPREDPPPTMISSLPLFYFTTRLSSPFLLFQRIINTYLGKREIFVPKCLEMRVLCVTREKSFVTPREYITLRAFLLFSRVRRWAKKILHIYMCIYICLRNRPLLQAKTQTTT